MIRLFCALLLASVAVACTPLSERRDAAADAATAASVQALRDAAPAGGEALAPWLQAQRERVAQQRDAAQARYDAAELGCWRRFAVNACLRQARDERRAAQDRLRQQALALNDIERQHRTQQRLHRLDDRQRGAAAR